MGVFRVWLENLQGIELQTAQFLEDMLDKSFQLMKQDSHPQRFTKYLRQVWPNNAQGFYLPQELGGYLVSFVYLPKSQRALAIHEGDKFLGFKINIRNLEGPIEEVEKEIESLKSAVHHESEHINNPGSNLQYWADEDENTKLANTLDYMNNAGEIQAHAREMARAYAKHYPNEPFNLEKAKSLLNLPYFNQTHKNYFDILSQPDKWQELRSKLGPISNPHSKILTATHQMLPQYQK